jgi:hypothetical protein
MNTGESSYIKILKNSMKNLAANGINEYLNNDELEKILTKGFSKMDKIVSISRLETSLDHYNNIKRKNLIKNNYNEKK